MIHRLTSFNSTVPVLLSVLALSLLTPSAAVYGRPVDIELTMNEFSWNEDGNVDFLSAYIAGDNGWGAADESDNYVQVKASEGTTDIFLPPDQEIVNTGGLLFDFDTLYLPSAQSYVSLGSDDEFENAIWVGLGNGQIMAGTGSEFDLSGSQPAGVEVAFTAAVDLTAGARIGIRLGYDIDNQRLRNVQVDGNNDGTFEELLDVPLDVSGADLSVEDWFMVSYFGKGETRMDDIRMFQELSLKGDYNRDFLFNEQDVDLICAGIRAGDSALDFNSDGVVNLEDRDDFLLSNNGLVADFDYSREVGFPDFLTLSTNFAQDGMYSQGDANCDGTINFPDFLALSTNFGNGTGAHAVPEPSASWLVLSSACLLLVRRRRD